MAGAQVTVALTQLEKQRLGYQAISLTNFELGTLPAIAAGSKVEIGGALYEFASEEAITGWGAIGTGNDVYIIQTVTGTAVAASFTTTAPTWSESKQGYYTSLVRGIGGLRKDADGDYTKKYLYQGQKVLHSAGGTDLFGEVGKVATFVTKTRSGWLWCDGSTIDKTANPEYTNLVDLLKEEAGADAAHPFYAAAANEAVLPDMRGAVARGVDDASNRDKDDVRKSGGFQDDDNVTHLHTIDHDHGNTDDPGTHAHVVPGRTTGGSGANNAETLDGAKTEDITSEGAGAHVHAVAAHSGNSGSTGNADEVTVKNIALYYLIKY